MAIKRYLAIGVSVSNYTGVSEPCYPIVEAEDADQALERAREWGADNGYFSEVEFFDALDADALRNLADMLDDEDEEPNIKEADYSGTEDGQEEDESSLVRIIDIPPDHPVRSDYTWDLIVCDLGFCCSAHCDECEVSPENPEECEHAWLDRDYVDSFVLNRVQQKLLQR